MAIGRRPAEPFAWRIYGLAKYRKKSANRTDVVHTVFIFFQTAGYLILTER